MTVYNIVDARKAVQYTGSNSAEIDTAISNLTIDAEAGGVLDVTSCGMPWVVNTGDWIIFWQGCISQIFTDAQFHFYLIQNAVLEDLDGFQAQVDGLDGRVDDLEAALGNLGGTAVRSVGVATAPTLLLGTPADVAVQLIPAMPDTSYTAQAYMFGSGVVGNVTINSTTITDNDTVTVNIQTSLLSLVGTHVLVVVRD